MATDYLSAVRLDDMLLSACGLHEDVLAVVDDDYALSFQELSKRSAQVAESMMWAGHRPGLPVVVAVDNRWTDIVAQLAVWRTHGVVVPVHRTTPARVLRQTAERAGARLVVSPWKTLPYEWPVALSQPLGWVHGLSTESQPPAELDSRQALVAFTSGSTGRAKGVVLSHSAFGSKLEAISSVIPFSAGSSTLQVLHLNFTFGQWTTLLTLVRGGTVHLVRKFVARNVLRRLIDQSVDRMAVVPTMLRLILADLDDAPAELNRQALAECSSPGLWIAGGEPLAAGLGRRVLETFPRTRLADVFGLSETSTSDIILTPDAYPADAGTIGRPSPGVQVRIVDENGLDQPIGVAGELWIKTPFLMTGYLADPESTVAAKSGDWFRTGDLARVIETGNIELVGRSRFLIMRGGHKLSPLSIEGTISDHPACRGACVFGIPDVVLGERSVLLFKSAVGVHVTPDQIRAWAKTRLQPYEVPDEITLVDELPLGGTGKMDRLGAREARRGATSGLHTQ